MKSVEEKITKTTFLLIIVLTLVSIVFGFVLCSTQITYFYSKTYPYIADCDGIDDFYTGKGFEDDLSFFKEIYLDNYNGTGTIKDTFLLDSPKEVFNSKYFDCDDYANFAMCLANKYGTNCSHYLHFGSEPHVGVECDGELVT